MEDGGWPGVYVAANSFAEPLNAEQARNLRHPRNSERWRIHCAPTRMCAPPKPTHPPRPPVPNQKAGMKHFLPIRRANHGSPALSSIFDTLGRTRCSSPSDGEVPERSAYRRASPKKLPGAFVFLPRSQQRDTFPHPAFLWKTPHKFIAQILPFQT